MQMLNISELHNVFKNLKKDELILDVRYPDEFQEGHVPGSKNISHDEVSGHAQELKKYSKIYIYCKAGGRAQKATIDLMNAGVSNIATVVGGGMPDWIANSFPVEK